jgi:hypothetical protein
VTLERSSNLASTQGHWGKTEVKLGGEGLRAARSRRALISILFLLLGSTLPGSKPSRAQTSEPTTEQLQREIRQRDAIIRSLVRRVEKLERQVGTGASASASLAATQGDRRQDHSPERGLWRRRSPPWRQRSRRLYQRRQAHPRRRRRVRHRRRRTPTHQRPGSSRSARRPRNARLNGRLSPPATCWCRKVLPKSNRC